MKKVAIIIGAILVAFLGFVTYSMQKKESAIIPIRDYEEMKALADAKDVSAYDENTVISGNADNGNISDHIKGDPSAPITIYEYADFQCDYCALYNPTVKEILEEFDGQIRIVYRNYLLSYHVNGTAAATAAEAAANQGLWEEMGDLLFENYTTWRYLGSLERIDKFTELFQTAYENAVAAGRTDVTNDVDQFLADLEDDAIAEKISFDMALGTKAEISGTPSFYLNGELIDLSAEDDVKSSLRSAIKAAIRAQSSAE